MDVTMDYMPTIPVMGVDVSYYSVEEYATHEWMIHSINNNNYIESVSRKRKGEELTTELDTLSISLGIEADYLVQENQKRKHIKTIELPTPEIEAPTPVNTPRSYARTVEIRFGTKQDTFRARIICKEPWGTLCELLEDATTDNEEPVPKSTRYWCKWDGSVNQYSNAVFEAMYPC